MRIILLDLIQVYGFAIIARIVLSWFPVSPGGAMASIFSFLYTITEPVLGPVRRVIPSIGMLDLSPLVVFFALQVLARAIASG